MTGFRSDFIHTLFERGFVHQVSDAEGLDQMLRQKSMVSYVGYDATAKSLHVGNLITIMMLRWFQKTGHQPMVVLGGGTTKIGDPSGKDEARPLITESQISENLKALQKIFAKFLDFKAVDRPATMINNAEWLDSLQYIDFLRNVGRHFSVNRMLSFESVKQRLDREQNLSFLEFNYMILQAYDFYELYRRYGCQLQMGGSDQWGNMVSGIDLGHRMAQAQLYVMTCPLLTTASGAKMGKTAQGAVWLDPDLLDPYDYWQFWRNCEDQDVVRFLKIFTELPMDEIKKMQSVKGQELNAIKKILATEATALCHGRGCAEMAQATAEKVFEQGQISDQLPVIEYTSSCLTQGVFLYDILREAGFAKSNSEARRSIAGGAIKINDQPVTHELFQLTLEDMGFQSSIKLSMGKKRHCLVKVVD